MHGQADTIRFKSINVENGLSSNNVLSLLQDSKGLLWIGTGYGLNKYDSYEFTYFNNDKSDSLSISGDVVSTIYQDGKNRLWIGTGNGINRFDMEKGEFQHFTDNIDDDLTSNYIRIFFEDSNGVLWVGTSKGLYFFDEGKEKFLAFDGEGNIDFRINAIEEDDSGKLLIGTLRGLYYLEEGNFVQVKLSNPRLNKILDNTEVRYIQTDSQDNIWVGTEGAGLFLINKDSKARRFTVNNTSGGLLSNHVRVVKITSQGKLWLGTRLGLSILDPVKSTFHSYQHDNRDKTSLSFNSIRAIIEDSSGGMWIATSRGGINYYNPNNNLFKRINQEWGHENAIQQIKAIIVDKNGNLYLGSEGNGISYYNALEDKFSFFQSQDGKKGLINNDVKSFSKDSIGNIWIGTYNGISYLNTKTKKFTNYSLSRFDSLNPLVNQVHTTLLDHKGNLWAGTNGAGLIYFDLKEGSNVHYKHDRGKGNSLITNHIDVLFQDKEHNIWVGTRQGLDILPYGEKDFKHTSLSEIKTQSIQQDKNGHIWIGTLGQGLFLYRENGKHLNFTTKDGLPGNVVYAILEDFEGNLWMSTNNGLSQMIMERDENLEFVGAKFINYRKSDGLQGNQFLQGSAFKTPDGQMYFGGINGLNFFYPKQIPTSISFSPVVFTGLKIKNREVLPGQNGSPLHKNLNYVDEIELSYSQSEFTIEFAALNYLSSNKNLYAYKLEGFDEEWNFIGKQLNATFTYPPAGDYTFKVRSSVNPERWPEEYASIKIHVLPPFWKRTWAYVLYVLIVLLLLYGYHKISQNYSNLRREKTLSKRKFEFFTDIAHEIKTPLTLILAPLEDLIDSNKQNARVQNQLSLMKTNGDRLVNLINQLLDYRKFEAGAMQLRVGKGNIVKFSNEIYLSFKGLADKKNVDFIFEAPETIELWYDRDKMEKVLLNILSNAFKFTDEGGKIWMRLSVSEGTGFKGLKNGACEISIENTGKIIPVEKLQAIFNRFMGEKKDQADFSSSGIGLDFAKRLVEIHKGRINVESKLRSNGQTGLTVFIVKLPLGNKHLKKKQILKNFKDSESIGQYVEEQVETMLPFSLAPVEKKETSDGNKIMLLVEDNTEVRQFIKSMFETDFKIYEAQNGEEGKLKALDIVPDIIISDVMMPVMDGIKLCEILKNDQRTSHIPIILLTARTPLVFRIEGIETGADDYVTKPFSTAYLKSRVNNLVHNREKLKEKFRKEMILQPQKLAITSPDEQFLKKILAYLEKNMDNPNLGVEDIGKEVGMSRSNLYRKIKGLTGLTIVQFVRNTRIKRAAQILNETSLNVSEIAYMVGFQDVDYFSKCFKKEFNIVPSKYTGKEEID